jgi:hypothetical protein
MRIGFFLLLVLFVSCSKKPLTDQELAEQHCGSCHQMPMPELLTKRVWYNDVLPQMKFRMGFKDPKELSTIPPEDREFVLEHMPKDPMITEADWDRLFEYYVSHAPEKFTIKEQSYTKGLSQFEVSTFSEIPPLVTALKFDPVDHILYVGTSFNYVYAFDKNLKKLDTLKVESTPSSIRPESGKLLVTTMGIMSPNDRAYGRIVAIDKTNFAKSEIIADSLRRPVFVEKADFNNDGSADLLVCNFGNTVGSVEIIEPGNGQAYVVNGMPGARNVILKDVNADGLMDFFLLITQGDERIIQYVNKGDFKFEEKVLLRFPPVYGSSFFELHDFNNDGKFDILYSNGDNADYSTILKPYHGIRIFENRGEDEYTESYFAPMPGCYQAVARDFDQDGDLDMAGISFFPDFDNQQGSFIYFENKGGYTFEQHVTPETLRGRWLTMEVGDFDGDKDEDIVIGALTVKGIGARDDVYTTWLKDYASLVVFKNRLN